MLSIKPVKVAAKGHNRWCGPAALSIISGIDTAQAAALLRHVSGRKSITGTGSLELFRALNALGYAVDSAAKVNPLKPKANPTLAAWLRETHSTRGNDVYLVAAGQHWQVIQGRRYCCGLSKDIVPLTHDRVARRARLTGVWRISLQFEPTTVRAEQKRVLASLAAAAVPKPDTILRQQTKRLADRHDIQLEVDGDVIYVWGPEFPEDIDEEQYDPYHGDHCVYSWADAHKRVEAYATLVVSLPQIFDRQKAA